MTGVKRFRGARDLKVERQVSALSPKQLWVFLRFVEGLGPYSPALSAHFRATPGLAFRVRSGPVLVSRKVRKETPE